ncbi:MAG TPA: PKD domain-containing protein, partial [Candidatus Dormibacteraeota bacterium]|nr:PKD domain-containing protein [Candidatus Dormibacteraeota bacterium]
MRNSPTAEPSFAARTRWVGTAAICIVLATVSVQAQFQLSQRVAGAADWPEGEVNTGLVLDTNNNCYLTGWFDGTNNFGGSTLTNQSIAGSDIFVAKYNSTGALQWAQRAGGTGINYGRAAGVDSNGSIYVTGGYQGPASFGGVNLPVTSGEQFFLAKYSSSGSVQWVKTSTNGSDDNYGIGLTVDGAGNSYALAVMDHSGASLTFGSITVTTTKLGYTLLVLVKYDNAGTAQWVRLFDSTAETYGSKLAADASGNVYVRGSFDSDMTIGSSNLVVSSGSTMNMFIAKFSSAGNLIWVQTPQGGDVGEGGVAVDAGANVYVSGAFDTNLNFGGGIILTNLAVFGDAFLAKYNSAGAIQWAKAAGGTNGGFYWDVALDGATNVYAAGFLGQFAAVAKYNSAGAPQWVYSATGLPGDPVASTATKCAVDAAGHCYLAGAYQGVAAFWTNALGPQDSWNFFLAEATTNPAVQFTANPNGGTVPLTVQFNSGSTDNQGNTISTWRWNFGDGGVSSLQNPSHTYTNVGTFYPGFIATNNHGVAVLGYGAPVSTWTPSAADFTYITNNGGLTVTGYIGSNSQVIIPSTANGWPVTAIGDGAF